MEESRRPPLGSQLPLGSTLPTILRKRARQSAPIQAGISEESPQSSPTLPPLPSSHMCELPSTGESVATNTLSSDSVNMNSRDDADSHTNASPYKAKRSDDASHSVEDHSLHSSVAAMETQSVYSQHQNHRDVDSDLHPLDLLASQISHIPSTPEKKSKTSEAEPLTRSNKKPPASGKRHLSPMHSAIEILSQSAYSSDIIQHNGRTPQRVSRHAPHSPVLSSRKKTSRQRESVYPSADATATKGDWECVVEKSRLIWSRLGELMNTLQTASAADSRVVFDDTSQKLTQLVQEQKAATESILQVVSRFVGSTH